MHVATAEVWVKQVRQVAPATPVDSLSQLSHHVGSVHRLIVAGPVQTPSGAAVERPHMRLASACLGAAAFPCRAATRPHVRPPGTAHRTQRLKHVRASRRRMGYRYGSQSAGTRADVEKWGRLFCQWRTTIAHLGLAREPTGMPSMERVDIGGLTLAIRVWTCHEPSGPPVILLPATGETAEDWDCIAAGLRQTRLVYAVNLRGHGKSDWPGTYSLRLMATDVTQLLDRMLTGQVDVIGHSLGGLVACIVAVERAGRVRRLILEDVILPHPRPAAAPTRPDGDLAFDWKVVEQVRPEIDDPDPAWASIIGGIAAPTLVIAGGPSSPMPQAHVAELANTLSDGHLVTVDAGHLVHANKPVEFQTHASAFLAC